MTDQRQLRLVRQASRRAALEQRVRRQRLIALGVGIGLVATTLIAVPLATSGQDAAPIAADATEPAPAALAIAALAEAATESTWGPAQPSAEAGTADLTDADTVEITSAATDSLDEAEALRNRSAELPVLSEGDSGAVIEIAQRALGVDPTGYFGPLTKAAVTEFQSGIGLPTTGMVATYTWTALGAKVVASAEDASASGGYVAGEPPAEEPAAEESSVAEEANVVAAGADDSSDVGDPPVLERTDVGQAVAVLQKALGISPGQGTFGPNTERVVKEFQAANGIPTTGVVARLTWGALGAEVSRAAAIAHATYGTDFGAAAGSGGGGSSGGNSGGGNSGGGNSGGGNSGGGNSGGGTNSIAGRFCPVKNFTWGQGLGAPRPGGRLHAGVDMMGKRGEPIYAVDSGTVTRAEYQSNGALVLDITGSKGMWFYGHFDSIKFSYGDKVQAGQIIGYMGDTGSPGAVHLHIELRPYGWSGGAADPLPLLKQLCA